MRPGALSPSSPFAHSRIKSVITAQITAEAGSLAVDIGGLGKLGAQPLSAFMRARLAK